MASCFQQMTFPDGRTLTITTGVLARQAHGSVVLKMGGTMLLATVVERKEDNPGAFLPLSVDYQENFFAGGKIPGGFLKREARLSEHEIIISRLVDRSIRPLFPKTYCHTVQVSISLISSDEEVASGVLAVLAASAALSISHIPLREPVAGVQIGEHDGQLCINPTPEVMQSSPLDVVISATANNILMLEGNMQEASEQKLLEIIRFAQPTIEAQCELQRSLAAQVQQAKEQVDHVEEDQVLYKALYKELYPLFCDVAQEGLKEKQQRIAAFNRAMDRGLANLDVALLGDKDQVTNHVAKIKRTAIRQTIIANGHRIDGRTPTEIRPIDIVVDYLDKAHGSALFTRGCTQVLATLTLGSMADVQHLDGVTTKGKKKLIVNYNFPSFATGEVKPKRSPGRREIGHGNLVYHAIKHLVPDTPYTIRLTAETLSSDGSSSMASVCGATLSLMDSGIGIANPVAGIAMGLVVDTETDQAVILSDILSEEDACGDADFKVTGTRHGITACQMDIKTEGISLQIMEKILQQAKVGREHILNSMQQAIPDTRQAAKPHTPLIKEMQVLPRMIGTVVGTRGKVIQALRKETGTDINISDEGMITIFSPNQAGALVAYQQIEALIVEPTVDTVYTGTVKAIERFGAFVEFSPGKQGLLHLTEIAEGATLDFLVGQTIQVKLIDISQGKGANGKVRYSLSTKQL